MKTKKTKKPEQTRSHSQNKTGAAHKKPFADHWHELRRRLSFIGGTVIVFSTAVYFVQMHVVNLLLKPAHGQDFIYTSPGGGIDFLFRICLYGGLILSTPFIVYHILGFVQPLMSHTTRRFVIWASMACGFLALVGVAFGYLLGLPSALQFLLHQFTTVQIQPLVTIQSYLNFVMAFLLGSALMFQLPLILICINRIKPLQPKRLFHYERWVILAAFILAALINPSPNVLSLLIVALPFIVMYQVGIGIIAFVNRKQPSKVKVEPVYEESVPKPITAVTETEIPTEPALVRSPRPASARKYMDFIPQSSPRFTNNPSQST